MALTDSYGATLGRVAFGATYTDRPDWRTPVSGQEIDEVWARQDQKTRDHWEQVAQAVVDGYRSVADQK